MNYYVAGGKGGCYQSLINLMPPHTVYVESHLGRGAVLRYKKPAKHNIGIDIDPKVIEMWNNTNRINFELIHQDAITFLKNYQFTGKELIYCDPPYIRETRKKYYPLYKYEYTYEQHIELLGVIKNLSCMVMISGYMSELYATSLKNWQSHSFQAATHHGVATEWVWMNYPAPTELHDYRYLGNNFREREKVKKMSRTWVNRLKAMPVLKRQAILSAIKDEIG